MFDDRRAAGRRLAASLEHVRAEQPIVLALPRGGVPVAAEVARVLHAPLDVIVVRKLGVPFQPELAMGALGEDGVRVLNDDVVRRAGVSTRELEAVEARERDELERRARSFRGDRPPIPIAGRTVIVVDDGIATGSTARAALRVARAHGAGRVVLAVPVAPPETARAMAEVADEVVCVDQPRDLWAVGAWYRDFSQTTDAEVVELLRAARRADERDGPGVDAGAGTAGRGSAEVVVDGAGVALPGNLVVPPDAVGLVVFAHGSGSSRHSPRNRQVAGSLQARRLATLLFDLLTPDEALDRGNVFDLELLGRRLSGAIAWSRRTDAVAGLPVGCFGASTGGGAALWAAAEPANRVAAVVSRGGRPDLAGPRLAEVRAPTLLIVGGADTVVEALNREAASRLRCEHRVEIVPGATHLFEEPGALEAVAELTAGWFLRHLPGP